MVSAVARSRPAEVVGEGSSGSESCSPADQVSKRALALHLGSYWVPVGDCHSLFSAPLISLVSLVSLSLTGTAGYSFRVVIRSVSYRVKRVHVVSSKMVVAKALLVVGIGWVCVAWMGHRLGISIAGVEPRAQGWGVVVAVTKGGRRSLVMPVPIVARWPLVVVVVGGKGSSTNTSSCQSRAEAEVSGSVHLLTRKWVNNALGHIGQNFMTRQTVVPRPIVQLLAKLHVHVVEVPAMLDIYVGEYRVVAAIVVLAVVMSGSDRDWRVDYASEYVRDDLIARKRAFQRVVTCVARTMDLFVQLFIMNHVCIHVHAIHIFHVFVLLLVLWFVLFVPGDDIQLQEGFLNANIVMNGVIILVFVIQLLVFCHNHVRGARVIFLSYTLFFVPGVVMFSMVMPWGHLQIR